MIIQAINHAVEDRIRRRVRQGGSLDVFQDESNWEPAIDDEPPRETCDDWFEHLQTMLPPSQYQAVVLRFREELRFEQMAQRMGVSKQRAEQVLKAAVLRLRVINTSRVLGKHKRPQPRRRSRADLFFAE